MRTRVASAARTARKAQGHLPPAARTGARDWHDGVVTAPTPSSPDPDHSRRSARPYSGRGGGHGGGRQGSHRHGDPSGGDPASGDSSASGDYGSAGDHRSAGSYGSERGFDAYGSGRYGSDAYGPDAYGHPGSYPSFGDQGQAVPGGPAFPDVPEEPRTDLRREVRGGALCALAVLVLGVGLGLLWLWLAPRVPLVAVDDGVFLKDPEGEEAIGADGTFVLLAVGFGVVTGVVAFLRSRGGGVGIVVGLAVGALLGSVLAWQLGAWLGPSSDLAASAKAAGENESFDGPLKLQAKGALLMWPFFALTTHLALMGVFGHRDPEFAPPAPPPLPPDDGGAAQRR